MKTSHAVIAGIIGLAGIGGVSNALESPPEKSQSTTATKSDSGYRVGTDQWETQATQQDFAPDEKRIEETYRKAESHSHDHPQGSKPAPKHVHNPAPQPDPQTDDDPITHKCHGPDSNGNGIADGTLRVAPDGSWIIDCSANDGKKFNKNAEDGTGVSEDFYK